MKPKQALSSVTDGPPAPIAFVDLKAQYARLKPRIAARIDAVLEHGRYIMGPEVGELEGKLADYCGAGHCVALSSGTDALLVALMAEGIGPGDAIFVPAFTFPATAEVVRLLGAVPVFVDVAPDSFNIDPDDLEERMASTERAGELRPRAVIAVDLYGLPADYPRLAKICGAHDAFLLADAAQSFGASQGNRKVGTLAPVTAVSFFPAKPLGCYGDGGALLTDDDVRAAVYRSIRAHGKGSEKYDIARVGLNARLDTLQAAILLAKLEVLDSELAARATTADAYDAALAQTGARLPRRSADACSAWAQYTIKVESRDAVAAALKDADVPTAVYYPKPLHLQPAYADFGEGPDSMPVSEMLCKDVLSLPMHGYLDEATISRVAAALIAALERHG